MAFMTSIIHYLNDVSSWFYSAYIEVLSWIDPFWRLYAPFYFLSTTFSSLAWQFYYFSDWINDVAYQVARILDWNTIWSYIVSYVPNITLIGQWFSGWWVDVWDVVTSWWSSTQSVILSWIDEAKVWAGVQIDQLATWFFSLEGEWNSFTTSTLPTLA